MYGGAWWAAVHEVAELDTTEQLDTALAGRFFTTAPPGKPLTCVET